MHVREKLHVLREEMNRLLFERSDEVTSLLIAHVARQHPCYVGPRGTTKSLMVRMAAHAVEGSRYWERLFNKFTEPNEVFGVIKVSALKQDRYERNVEHHLPWCTHGFIDEAFKANSSILNSLLTITNERIFHNDGEPMKVPLEMLAVASNEIPQDETLAALYDRFLIRHKVGYIAETEHFIQMISGPRPDVMMGELRNAMATRAGGLITLDELHAAQQESAQVAMSRSILEGIASIRNTLVQQGVQPSDRRYKDATTVIRAKAWMMGRNEAVMDDLSILTHVLWDDPQHVGLVKSVVLDIANPLLKQAEELNDRILGAWSALQKIPEDKRPGEAAVAANKINKASKDLQKLKDQGDREKQDMSKVEGFLTNAKDLRQRIAREYLGLESDIKA